MNAAFIYGPNDIRIKNTNAKKFKIHCSDSGGIYFLSMNLASDLLILVDRNS